MPLAQSETDSEALPNGEGEGDSCCCDWVSAGSGRESAAQTPGVDADESEAIADMERMLSGSA